VVDAVELLPISRGEESFTHYFIVIRDMVL
jgi:hypothetical protein